MSLHITVAEAEPASVLILDGDLDLLTAPGLRERITELHDGGAHRVVVDLSDVAFLDSSGLGEFVRAERLLSRAGGYLRLAAPRPNVRKVFDLTRLAQIVPLYDSVDAAQTDG